MSEIDDLEDEAVTRLSEFFMAKTAKRRGRRAREVGCLCHKPDGVVKRWG